ncbi:MAG: DUF3368 domain-containing protein [Limisphaerales bacterium]
MTVVTDTSVVLNLCFIGQQGLLSRLFTALLAPPRVAAEFQRLAASDPRFQGLVFPPVIRIAAPAGSPPAVTRDFALHGGEIAALSLALKHRADLVLMDEREGRAAARALGLASIGVVGILLQARERSLIPALAPLLDKLQAGARFWIAPSLRTAVLRAAGEAA